MDIIQAWTLHFLASHENLRTYAPYVGKAYGYMAALKSYTTPILTQVYNKPDLATVALLLIILFVSLKILNMVYQTFVFWLRTAVRVVFWGCLGTLAVWMYHRGPDGVVEDVSYWYGAWSGEYEYWKEREQTARQRGGAGRSGWY